eukprot:4503727-Prymnesium_polylepis.1
MGFSRAGGGAGGGKHRPPLRLAGTADVGTVGRRVAPPDGCEWGRVWRSTRDSRLKGESPTAYVAGSRLFSWTTAGWSRR